jgi:RNA polymerase sigma factor (sigma-70 family)
MSENDNLPATTNDSWRSWLTSGVRRVALDRRRLQGSHRGLKKILAEGLTGSVNSLDTPYTWKETSGAMVRHAVDDAMNALPPEDTEVVKLAYFGGYSNREIAEQVGMTEGAVQRRLRNALAKISNKIQHGHEYGRRAVYGIAAFLSGKWLSEPARHAWQVTAVAGVAAVTGVAAVIVASQPAPTAAAPGHAAPGAQSAPAATKTVVPLPSPSLPVALPAEVHVPTVQVPTVQVPTVQVSPLPSPSLPPLPPRIKNLL